MTHPSPRRITDRAAVILAPNPGPMTLDGTNSYLLSGPDSASLIVVDPGPLDAGHLAALAAAGPVELILITHRHHDHTEGAAELSRLTGAPVRAADPDFCIGGKPLRDGEVIDTAGVSVTVVGTPGHTSDSVSFLVAGDGVVGDGVAGNGVAGDGAAGSALTGDTILGRGTTVIAPPDGSLADYLASLRLLAGFGPRFVLPAHGPARPDLSAVAAEYLAHREQRLAAIRIVLDELGQDASIGAVTDAVYTDIDPSVRFAAEHSVAAQLEYLRGPGAAGR